MTLSEELTWRGFTNQTTLADIAQLNGDPIHFYWGVDPSADSMTIGNLAMAMMVRHFIAHGHKATLLVGGATGLIGDPDGKSRERELVSQETIEHNKAAITAQYQSLFTDMPFSVVDNYDWFKDFNYLSFLRDIGKHVPMRQMLGREFVQSRLGEDGAGISYAEFSYALIQGYDFLHLHREHGVMLQVSGADQWGNSIAGVDLIRRITGNEAHVWTAPLVVNKVTGVKFGKSEAGAIWIDPAKTSPTQFYQFWINVDDIGVEDYLKIYTLLDQDAIETLLEEHRENPGTRLAQTALARAVTELVHGETETNTAARVTEYLTGQRPLQDAAQDINALKREVAVVSSRVSGSITEVLVSGGLANSNGEARRLLAANAISINGNKTTLDTFHADDFVDGRLLLRRGKAYKDTILVEVA